ncbi:hypothetical protein [Aeromonas allosaccharophila]
MATAPRLQPPVCCFLPDFACCWSSCPPAFLCFDGTSPCYPLSMNSKKGFDIIKGHTAYQPDKAQILSRFQQTCTAKNAFYCRFESRFDGEPKVLGKLIRITFSKSNSSQSNYHFLGEKMGQSLTLPHFIARFN